MILLEIIETENILFISIKQFQIKFSKYQAQSYSQNIQVILRHIITHQQTSMLFVTLYYSKLIKCDSKKLKDQGK